MAAPERVEGTERVERLANLQIHMQNEPYKKLIVWKEAHNFVLQIYKVTDLFPDYEKYGIVSQIRRSAVSIPTNIVEGHARNTKKDFLRFINICQSSSKECCYLLELAKDLEYITPKQYAVIENQRRRVDYLIGRLSQSLT